MALRTSKVPEGWVPGHKAQGHLWGFVFLVPLLPLLVLTISFHLFLQSIQLVTFVLMSAMLIVLNLVDRGRDPGAYVKLFPYARTGTERPGDPPAIVDRFVHAFGDLELTAEPGRRGRGRPYSTRLVLSQRSGTTPFITVGHRPQSLIEIGVAEKAVGSIPMIEAFFRSEGALGTAWEPPKESWIGVVAALIGMLVVLYLPFLLILSAFDWRMMTLCSMAYLSIGGLLLALALRNRGTDRLLMGSASKHLVMGEEDLAEVILRASTRMGFHARRADADIPVNRPLLRRDNERIVAMFTGDNVDFTVLLARRIVRGVPQGYMTVRIPHINKMDERLANKLQRSIDATLALALAEKRSGEFLGTMP